MAQVSRRSFLRNSGLAVAGAGVMSQMPLLSGLVGAGESDAPAVTGAADAAAAGTEDATASLAEPLVAHVRDVSTGEIGIFNGTREVVVNDPQLAARLFRAAR
ncbi:MAG: hypothetical protein ACRDY1_06155 [Acidimicrobiales bacterium]